MHGCKKTRTSLSTEAFSLITLAAVVNEPENNDYTDLYKMAAMIRGICVSSAMLLVSLKQQKTRWLFGMPTIQYSAGRARLYLIGGFLGPPEFSTQTASQLLQQFLHGSLCDRPTDHATRSATIGGIYVRSTVMWSNNNCSICRLVRHGA